MKKLCVVILFLFPFVTIAQVRIGGRAGVQFATFYFKNTGTNRRGIEAIIPRLSAGFQVEFPLSNNWFINSGLYYSGKGTISGRTFQSHKRDSATIHLNYIELPVLFTYRLGDEERHDLKIGAGPYIAYGFLGSLRWKGGRPPTEYHLHQKENDHYRRLEIGTTFFSQYKFNKRWGMRLDLSRSLISIRTPEHDKTRNIVAGLSLIYQFNKKTMNDQGL